MKWFTRFPRRCIRYRFSRGRGVCAGVARVTRSPCAAGRSLRCYNGAKNAFRKKGHVGRTREREILMAAGGLLFWVDFSEQAGSPFRLPFPTRQSWEGHVLPVPSRSPWPMFLGSILQALGCLIRRTGSFCADKDKALVVALQVCAGGTRQVYALVFCVLFSNFQYLWTDIVCKIKSKWNTLKIPI